MEVKNTGMEPRREPVSSARPSEGPVRSGATAPSARPSADSQDRLTLTGAAQSLLEIRSEADSGAPVDRARVASIRSAIENGTYTVRPERIAEALIRQDNSR